MLTMIDDTYPSRPTKSDESGRGTKEIFPWLLFARINVQYLRDCKLLFPRLGKLIGWDYEHLLQLTLTPELFA